MNMKKMNLSRIKRIGEMNHLGFSYDCRNIAIRITITSSLRDDMHKAFHFALAANKHT